MRQMHSNMVYYAAWLLALLPIFGCMPVPAGETPQENYRLGEDIHIAGADVSRLEVAHARKVVQQSAKAQIESMELTLTLRDLPGVSPIKLRGTELPIRTNVEQVLHQAAYLTQYRPIGQPVRSVPLTFTLDEPQGRALATRLAARLSLDAVDATCTFDPAQEGLFIYTQSSAGRSVDPSALYTQLAQAVQEAQTASITAAWKPIAPTYTIEDAMADHRLIATYATSYAKSPHNAAGRVFNIKKAASLINGVTLAPGAQFDMNAILGPRNKDTGWRKAAGIRDGKYEQEYGGGVCQVSTTLFNAVMMADLSITERRPHSWPSGYVDIGRDATISTGGPNFRFVNSSPSEIVVVAETDSKKKLHVSIYGRPLADGVRIRISSKRTGTLPALGTEIKLDSSLPAGTSVEERQERRGKTSETYKEYYDADGALIRVDTAYRDRYRSIRGIRYVAADLYYGG